jgi:hypothetical protein
MPLADLRALARAYAGGTHRTRDADGARSAQVDGKTEEIRHIPNAGTPRTRGTREHGDTGMSAGTVAMNCPLPMSPPSADRALPAAIAVPPPAEVPDQAQPAPPPSEPAWPPDLLLSEVPDHNVVLPSACGAQQAPAPAPIVALTIDPISPLPPLPPIPADPAAALALLRENGCQVWFAKGKVRIAPTWRIRPPAVERLKPMAEDIAALLLAEDLPRSGAGAGPALKESTPTAGRW